MKAYVIITLNLCAMHGANMYIYNKTQYLKAHGYKVLVYSAEQGDIAIPGLREYKRLQSPYLRFYPGIFHPKKLERFLSALCAEIGAEGCEEIIVESTNIYSAMWGELIAQRLHGRHLTIIMQERFGYSAAEKDFLRFKLGRFELSGINELAVSRMLEDESVCFDDSMKTVAYCNNTIDECADEISPRLEPEAALTIGSIGRLEKKYVLPLATQLAAYAKLHPQAFYHVVFVGGTREKKQIRRIQNAFAGCGNVKLVLAGEQFPIPRSFVDRCDLFVSAAGSAWATYYLEKPTIFLNPGTGDIIGIPGLTCREGDFTIYSANAPITELGSMIELLLKKKGEIRFEGSMIDGSYKKAMEAEFEREIGFVKRCSTYEYYDTRRVKFAEKMYRPFNVLGKLVDPKLLYHGLVLARKLIK